MDVDFDDSSDMYEGGRKAVRDAARDYNDVDDEYGAASTSTSARDKKAQKEMSN